MNPEMHTVVYDPITEEVIDLIGELNFQMLRSDTVAVVKWHESLTNTQRLRLRHHANDAYVECLERIASDFSRQIARGRRISDADLMKSLACTIRAKQIGRAVGATWTIYSKFKGAERQMLVDDPKIKPPHERVSNPPKKFRFTQIRDYDFIEELWSDGEQSNYYRTFFDLDDKPNKKWFKTTFLKNVLQD
ncbi:hypothetical protein XMD530_001386 [Marinobacterium sp. xm-d-530]|nr:hypothetical protein [Marinobacterium sp. xm-d-530]